MYHSNFVVTSSVRHAAHTADAAPEFARATPMVDAGIAVGIAVGVAIFLFLLWMISVPICGAPRPVSTVFALLARSIKKRKKWGYTVVDGGRIVLGSVPRSHEHLLELRREHNVRAVITLNQAWEPQVNGGVARACAQCEIEHLGLPTPDFAAPSQRDIRRAVEFMSAQIAAGGAVYVHCNGGKGRTGLLVACALHALRGHNSVGAAVREMRACRAGRASATIRPSATFAKAKSAATTT